MFWLLGSMESMEIISQESNPQAKARTAARRLVRKVSAKSLIPRYRWKLSAKQVPSQRNVGCWVQVQPGPAWLKSLDTCTSPACCTHPRPGQSPLLVPTDQGSPSGSIMGSCCRRWHLGEPLGGWGRSLQQDPGPHVIGPILQLTLCENRG